VSERSGQCAVRRGATPRQSLCALGTALSALGTALCALIIAGCATTTPPPAAPTVDHLHGVASWYGQEFAGRTTANGEIFDPMLFTAAHRTLPFGTVVDVMNAKTGQMVRVRINDRGPFVGNRMIDLSYAAAQQIGLIDDGSGEVDVKVVSIGRGDREPPAAYTITVPQPAEVKIAAAEPPKVEFPLPSTTTEPVVVDNVQVIEKHGDTYTRRTVAADGRTLESVPVTPSPSPPAPLSASGARGGTVRAESPLPATRGEGGQRPGEGSFVVQVGAFSIEANAKALQTRLSAIGQRSHIDHDELYRVRLGPFATRDEAIRARTLLEGNGISAIVVAP
jgi:peptidoglycan lytic transglycosylase